MFASVFYVITFSRFFYFLKLFKSITNNKLDLFFNLNFLFLLLDIKGLEEVEKVEEINKKYWYACQQYIETRSPERNRFGNPGSAPARSSRFRDLMLCLPEIRFVVGKLLNCDFSKLPLLFKVKNNFFNFRF